MPDNPLANSDTLRALFAAAAAVDEEQARIEKLQNEIKALQVELAKDERISCNRCGHCANPNAGWEHDWPLYGRIEIGFPAQIFCALGSGGHTANDEDFELWHNAKSHGAVKDFSAQSITLEWGNGYKFDSRGKFRLCYNCQKALLQAIGAFFFKGDSNAE